jgi:hypothetical protein
LTIGSKILMKKNLGGFGWLLAPSESDQAILFVGMQEVGSRVKPLGAILGVFFSLNYIRGLGLPAF